MDGTITPGGALQPEPLCSGASWLVCLSGGGVRKRPFSSDFTLMWIDVRVPPIPVRPSEIAAVDQSAIEDQFRASMVWFDHCGQGAGEGAGFGRTDGWQNWAKTLAANAR